MIETNRPIEGLDEEQLDLTETSGELDSAFEATPAGFDKEELLSQFMEKYDEGWTELPNPDELNADLLVAGNWLVNGEKNLTQEIRESGDATRQERHDKIISDLMDFSIAESVEEMDGQIMATVFYLEGDSIRHAVFVREPNPPQELPNPEPGDLVDVEVMSDQAEVPQPVLTREVQTAQAPEQEQLVSMPSGCPESFILLPKTIF